MIEQNIPDIPFKMFENNRFKFQLKIKITSRERKSLDVFKFIHTSQTHL